MIPTARIERPRFKNAPSKLARISFPWNGTRAGSIAAVERGPSVGARFWSRGVPRVSFHAATSSLFASGGRAPADRRSHRACDVDTVEIDDYHGGRYNSIRDTVVSSARHREHL